jgi:predicted dehydrogenase
MNKTLHVTKNADLFVSFPPNSSYRLESISQRVFVPLIEPLVSELRHFGTCINENTIPLTDGDSALRAIRIAEDITHNSDIGSKQYD